MFTVCAMKKKRGGRGRGWMDGWVDGWMDGWIHVVVAVVDVCDSSVAHPVALGCCHVTVTDIKPLSLSGFIWWVWRQIQYSSPAFFLSFFLSFFLYSLFFPRRPGERVRMRMRMQLHHAAHCAHMVTADKAASHSLPLFFPTCMTTGGFITPVRLWLLDISSDLRSTPTAACGWGR